MTACYRVPWFKVAKILYTMASLVGWLRPARQHA